MDQQQQQQQQQQQPDFNQIQSKQQASLFQNPLPHNPCFNSSFIQNSREINNISNLDENNNINNDDKSFDMSQLKNSLIMSQVDSPKANNNTNYPQQQSQFGFNEEIKPPQRKDKKQFSINSQMGKSNPMMGSFEDTQNNLFQLRNKNMSDEQFTLDFQSRKSFSIENSSVKNGFVYQNKSKRSTYFGQNSSNIDNNNQNYPQQDNVDAYKEPSLSGMSFENMSKIQKKDKLLNPSDGESIQLDFDFVQDQDQLQQRQSGNRIKTITRRQSTLITPTNQFAFNSDEKFQRSSKRHVSTKLKYNHKNTLLQPTENIQINQNDILGTIEESQSPNHKQYTNNEQHFNNFDTTYNLNEADTPNEKNLKLQSCNYQEEQNYSDNKDQQQENNMLDMINNAEKKPYDLYTITSVSHSPLKQQKYTNEHMNIPMGQNIIKNKERSQTNYNQKEKQNSHNQQQQKLQQLQMGLNKDYYMNNNNDDNDQQQYPQENNDIPYGRRKTLDNGDLEQEQKKRKESISSFDDSEDEYNINQSNNQNSKKLKLNDYRNMIKQEQQDSNQLNNNNNNSNNLEDNMYQINSYSNNNNQNNQQYYNNYNGNTIKNSSNSYSNNSQMTAPSLSNQQDQYSRQEAKQYRKQQQQQQDQQDFYIQQQHKPGVILEENSQPETENHSKSPEFFTNNQLSSQQQPISQQISQQQEQLSSSISPTRKYTKKNQKKLSMDQLDIEQLDKKKKKKEHIDTSHAPINLINLLTKHLLTLYKRIPCKNPANCETIPIKNLTVQEIQNSNLCKKCKEVQYIEEIKHSKQKNINNLAKFWQSSSRIKLISEDFLINNCAHRFVRKNYVDKNRKALIHCLPQFIRGNRNPYEFWKLQ